MGIETAVKNDVKKGDHSYGLKSETLSPWETIGQSVANIAPTATPTVVIPLVFAVSGGGTWLAYLIATISILFVILLLFAEVYLNWKQGRHPRLCRTFAK